MFKLEEQDECISFKFSAEMKLVDRLMNEIREILMSLDIKHFSSIKLVLRELLINAVEHGCKNNRNMGVGGFVKKIAANRYMFQVEDEGEGFDHHNLNLVMSSDPASLRSRGFPLIMLFPMA